MADREIKETSLPLPSNTAYFRTVRVSILSGVSNAVVETKAPYRITDSEGRLLMRGEKIVSTSLKTDPTGVRMGAQLLRGPFITLESEDGITEIQDKPYRGRVIIYGENAKHLQVVNEIDIEDYLKGVIGWEANPKWPLDALKAQAVASRTYALFKMVENQDQRFDVSKDVFSQVYKGIHAESERSSRAVEATRGEILTHRGRIFPAYYHSTCGGGTTHAEYLWNVKPHPALSGVTCEFCQASKHFRWQETFSSAQIEAVLKKHGHQVSGIERIEPVDLDKVGRARNFLIKGRNGTVKVEAGPFRLWMDPGKFKSTLIRQVERTGNGFLFSGRGWGHGVGMCQYGMKGLADLGYAYRQILQYYYPGAEIVRYFG